MKSYCLTESRLRGMIKDAVKNVLEESTLYCNTKPFENIISAANTIMESFNYVNDEDWEPNDDCDGRDLAPYVYEWAKKVSEDAEYWLRHNSSYSSINGGENW